MKQILKGAVLLSLSAALMTACEDRAMGDAYISFGMSSAYNHYEIKKLDDYFKASGSGISLPDTNHFILSVTDASGASIYYGNYGDKPDPMNVSAGTYNLAVYSEEFTQPAFSSPQIGDYRTIAVSSGENVAVSFGCTQLNSGMRLVFDKSFRDKFFGGIITLQSEEGELEYPFTESRIAYFNPGRVSVQYTKKSLSQTIVSRELAAADIYTLKLAASSEKAEGFSITVDTSRNWINEDFTVGSGNDGSSMDRAVKICDLEKMIDAKDIWVTGYIVGGDVSNSKVKFEGPFSKATHIAIADSPDAETREECAAVELPSSSKAREALNLVDHQENIGKKVYVKGNIVNYYGHPGVKAIKEYQLAK